MSGFVFGSKRVEHMHARRDQVHATLLPISPPIHPGRLRRYYKEWVRTDENGRPFAAQRDVVGVLTVVRVEKLETFSDQVTITIAKACGHKGPNSLRDEWRGAHPRSPLAQCCWFVLGDWRDRDRYLQRDVWRGGDYVNGYDPRRVIDELPALSKVELEEIGAWARLRDAGRRVEAEAELKSQSLADRVARLEAAGGRMAREIAHEVRIITERTERGLRRLG